MELAVTPLHDMSGAVVGWIHQDRILERNGVTVGWLRDHRVHRLGGRHVGSFENGWLRDDAGFTVAFTRGAHGGPVPPVPSVPPVPPVAQVPPVPPVMGIPMVRPVPMLGWSRRSLGDLLS